MAATHGTLGIFKVHDGTSLRDVSNYLETAALKKAIDTAETSGLGDTAKEYVLGLLEASITGNGNYDATFDGYLYAIESGRAAVAWEYYPADDTSGAVKYSGNCLLTKWDTESKVDAKNTVEIEFQVTGAVTRATV